MSEFDITCDPLNPAQVFACAGLLEAVALRHPAVLGHFQYDPRHPRQATFRLAGADLAGASLPAALKAAQVEAVPGFSGGEAPIRLHVEGWGHLELDWWLLPTRTEKSDLKLWAGQQTTVKLVHDMQEALPDGLDPEIWNVRVAMSGRFGLDPRAAWNALDFGSSPDAQGQKVYTFPATELFAAIGLQGHRPRPLARGRYAYWLWLEPLPLVAARAACGGALPDPATPAFQFEVSKRNKSYSSFTFAHPLEGGRP
jgi:hypothetical protein